MIAALAAVALALVPLVVKADFVLTIFIFSFILGIAAVGFDIIFGIAGQLSMFHAASFGIAGYTTFLVMKAWALSFWLGLLPALALVVAMSVVIGSICFKFRLKAFYFAVVTLAFSELARLVVMNWTGLTNGTLGLMIMAKPVIGFGSLSRPIEGTLAWYYLTLVSLALAVVAARAVVRSWIGRACGAIRLNEDLAQTLGIDIFRYKMLAFAIANVLAALAGALFAFYTGYIDPSYLSIGQSLDIIAMVLIGGQGTVLGPVVGAFVLTGLPHLIEIGAEQRAMLIGAILIAAILLFPRGIVGSLIRLARRAV
ncbi:MAG: branched-chain amino acid ABC transporter permease [Alphaproteobacteria bacterium]|nr:branched-chain amino acid ABC transporter permease [Alphaproteobacteria bacterium]